MREFPAKFNWENLHRFPQFKYDRDICYLREAIYEWFLNEKPEEKKPRVQEDLKNVDVPLGSAPSLNGRTEIGPFESPFDLNAFCQKHNPCDFKKMIATVIDELKKLGWQCFLGYNDTSLWIHPPKQVPRSLPDWQ
jgi:hypothetical protein